MHLLTSAVQISLYVLMAVILVAAIGAVTIRNLFHAALCLVAMLLGIAGIYLALHAEFLAVVQILIYVGAVMTLVIFAIMLTERFGDKSVASQNQLGLPAFATAIIFAIALGGILQKIQWPINRATLQSRVSVAEIGEAFMRTYVFPFEVISIVLIVVLVGAIVIAKKDPS